MEEKKNFLQKARDEYRKRKASDASKRGFDAALQAHGDATKAPADQLDNKLQSSESSVRDAFITLSANEFTNTKPEKAFDRVAFFAKHEDAFVSMDGPEVKDYPADRLTKSDVADMKSIYGFSNTYENTIYKEMTPEARAGYRTALMATGQIAGYVSVPEYQKATLAVFDMRKKSIAAKEGKALDPRVVNAALGKSR